jgi:hypothetical protein
VMKKGAAKAVKEVRQGPFGPHFNRQGGGRTGGPRRGMNRGLRGPGASGPSAGGASGPGGFRSGFGGGRPGASGGGSATGGARFGTDPRPTGGLGDRAPRRTDSDESGTSHASE